MENLNKDNYRQFYSSNNPSSREPRTSAYRRKKKNTSLRSTGFDQDVRQFNL